MKSFTRLRSLIALLSVLALVVPGAAFATNVSGGSNTPGSNKWIFKSVAGNTDDSRTVESGGYCSAVYSGTDTMILYVVPTSDSGSGDGTAVATFVGDSTAAVTFQPSQPYLLADTTVATAGDGVLTVRCTNYQLGASGGSSSQIVINEALRTPIRITTSDDDDGDPSGFVELKNTGGALDVAGFTVVPVGSPHPSFTLPSVTVAAGGYLRIWTGAKNRDDAGGGYADMHAPFSLAGASSIELRDASGAPVDLFDISRLPADFSLGLCEESCGGRAYEYFSTPSPDAANTVAGGAVRAEVAAPADYSVSPRRTTQIPAYYTPTDGGGPQPIGSAATAALDWGWMQLDSSTGQVYSDFDVSKRWRSGDTTQGQPNHLAQDTLTFTKDGDSNTEVLLTITGWEAHYSTIDWTNVIHGGIELGRIATIFNGTRLNDGWVYFAIDSDSNIYRTNDGFITNTAVGTRPSGQSDWTEDDRMLRTSFGDFYFARDYGTETGRSLTVYRSNDGMATWTAQTASGGPGTTIRETPLQEGYDWYYDADTNTGYVVTVEYDSCADNGIAGPSDDPCAADAGGGADFTVNLEHRVWLATYTGAALGTAAGDFDIIHTFDSSANFASDPATYPDPAAHIHAAWFDPWTGDLWVGTGDASIVNGQDSAPEVQLIVSNDFGSSFYPLAQGMQKYRTLSFWGTERGIYMNTDSGVDQYISFIPRSKRGESTADEYESMTPEISFPATLDGGLVYILRALGAGTNIDDMDESDTGLVVGQIATSDAAAGTALVSGDIAQQIGTNIETWGVFSDNDYRVKVALLDGNEHYYTSWGDSSQSVRLISGANTVIGDTNGLTSANRRTRRGNTSFLWAITEEGDDEWGVQEVYSESVEPEEFTAQDNVRRQFRPSGVDANSNLYFATPKTWTTQRVGKLVMGAVPAAQTNGYNFARDPDGIGCYTFENASNLGEDSCVWTSGLLDLATTSGTTVIQTDWVNADRDGGGLAGQTTGPFGSPQNALDVTDVGGNQRALYYDDGTARDFEDEGFVGYTLGCFWTSQKTGTADAILFGQRGSRTSAGSHGLLLDYNSSNYYGLSYRGAGWEVPSSNTATASLGTWHFLAARIRRVVSTFGLRTGIADGGSGYTGERDVYMDGVLTNAVDKDFVNDAGHASSLMSMGAFLGSGNPPANFGVSLNGYMADCFWTRRDLSDEELCQICSCGLEGDVATGTGRNASCNSCTMAASECNSDPF